MESSHCWDCLFLQGAFLKPWHFGENFRIMIHSLVFPFQLSLSGFFRRRLQSCWIFFSHCRFTHELLRFFFRLIFLLVPSLVAGLLISNCSSGGIKFGIFIPFSSRFDWRVSEVLGTTALILWSVSQEALYPTSFHVFPWKIFFWRADYLLYQRIFGVVIFPRVLWVGEDKIEVIEWCISNFLLIFIIYLPCHIVTLKSAVWFNYGYPI